MGEGIKIPKFDYMVYDGPKGGDWPSIFSFIAFKVHPKYKLRLVLKELKVEYTFFLTENYVLEGIHIFLPERSTKHPHMMVG